MILDSTPISLEEVEKIIKEIPDSDRKEEIKLYLKKFLKTDEKRTEKIRVRLEKLDLLKLKREHVIKIIDILPEDASDLNKIFTDISLTEDETNKILDIIKNSK